MQRQAAPRTPPPSMATAPYLKENPLGSDDEGGGRIRVEGNPTLASAPTRARLPGAVFGCSPSVPNRPQPPLCGQTAAVTVNLIQSLYHPHFVAPKDEIEKWEAVQSSFTAPILGLCHHFHAFIPNQMTLVSYTAFCWMALWSRAQLLSPYFGGLPLMCAGYCPPPLHRL